MNFLKHAESNWKTTASGVLAFVTVLANQLNALIDNNPETIADWNLVVAALVAMIGLFSARDADKSSEETGIK